MKHTQLAVTTMTRSQIRNSIEQRQRKSRTRDSHLSYRYAIGRGPKSELPLCRER